MSHLTAVIFTFRIDVLPMCNSDHKSGYNQFKLSEIILLHFEVAVDAPSLSLRNINKDGLGLKTRVCVGGICKQSSYFKKCFMCLCRWVFITSTSGYLALILVSFVQLWCNLWSEKAECTLLWLQPTVHYFKRKLTTQVYFCLLWIKPMAWTAFYSIQGCVCAFCTIRESYNLTLIVATKFRCSQAVR